MMSVYRNSNCIEWKPSAVVALATSVDDSQVAAAREDCSIEIWRVSPGSVGWHSYLTIHGNSDSQVSSLVWCKSSSTGSPLGRLFSSSIDGTISEWDLYDLKQRVKCYCLNHFVVFCVSFISCAFCRCFTSSSVL